MQSNLSMQTAYPAFLKLSKFLAICVDPGKTGTKPEYVDNPTSNEIWDDKKVGKYAFFYKIKWLATIDKGWRRLTYEDFCRWYKLPASQPEERFFEPYESV